jgi:hypothetical protein
MEFDNFIIDDVGNITGEGSDTVGKFSINGKVDLLNVTNEKF